MTTSSNSLSQAADQLLAALNAKRGECCRNPVTDGGFVWGIDPIAPQKKAATAALRAREWFAVNGPPDAPPLPLSHDDIEDYRNARGLAGIVGFFARSLKRLDYDLRNHPSFDDFARGLMALAMEKGIWNLEKDEALIRRFPPRPLEGMDSGAAFWDPPKRKGAVSMRSRRLPTQRRRRID
jgi:hypothetical protein